MLRLFSLLALSGVGAIPIQDECLSKENLIAGSSAPTGSAVTVFDWTDEVSTIFNTQSIPVLMRSCQAANGDLNSFIIVMRGYDSGTNVLSKSAGPNELGTCAN